MVENIVPIFVTTIYVALLCIFLLNRPWQRQHKLFIIYLLSAVLWGISDFIFRSGYFPDHKYILIRIVIVCSFLWVIQLYYFFRAFLKLPAGKAVYFGYITLGILSLLAIFGQAPPGIIVNGDSIRPVVSWWYPFWVVPMFVLALLGIYSIFKRLRIAQPGTEERNRIYYFFIAVSILIFFGLLAVIPHTLVFPWSFIGTLLSALIFTYAILQHELIGVSLIFRRFLAWFVLSVIGIAAYLMLVELVSSIVPINFNGLAVFVSITCAFLVAIFLIWLRPRFTSKVEQLFSRDKYFHQEKLLNFVRNDIRGVSDLKDLSQKFLQPLVKVINCHRAYMLLPSSKTGDYLIEFCEPFEKIPELRIKKNSPILSRLMTGYLTKGNIEINPEFRGIWSEERAGIKYLNIELLLPFISRNNLIGILALGKKSGGSDYSFDDIKFLESITEQLAVSLEKEYYQEELRKREQEVTLINRLTLLISSSLNIREVFDSFVSGLCKVVPVDFAAIAIIDGDELQYSAISSKIGLPWKVDEMVIKGGTGTEWVTNNKRSLVESDLTRDSIFVDGEKYKSIGIRTIAYLPLFVKGNSIGSLNIASKNTNAFTDEHINLLERLTSQIATSIDNAQLYSKAEQRARIDELTGLFNRRHFDELIRQETNRHSRYGNTFTLAFIDLDKFKSYNDTTGHLEGDNLLKNIGQIIKRNIRDIDTAFRYGGDEFAIIMAQTSATDALRATERLRSKIGDETSLLVTASIGLASFPADGLLPDEIVNAADTALYHAKHTGGNRSCMISQVLPVTERDDSEETGQPERESLNTIYALAATIEARDSYTYGHSRKVRGYAVALAEAINLSAERVIIVSHAALLHDIGKIGIVDEILNKPGTLDEHEIELIRTHPLLSRNIVAHVKALTPCLPAILYHHERWDGKGYPSGLKEEMIPIEARILSISDAYDAMTSLRRYRTPLSIEQAVEELRENAGIQFDPDLVEIFIKVCTQTEDKELIDKTTVSDADN